MDYKNQFKSTRDWLLSETKGVCEAFRSPEDLPIFFDGYEVHPENEWLELIPGCEIRIYERVRTETGFILAFKIECHMTAGTVLGKHHHPDYFEIFNIKVGGIVDLISGYRLHSNSVPHKFGIGISHHIKCVEDCTMIIDCVRDLCLVDNVA